MGLLPTHLPCLLRSVQAYTSSSIFLASGMSSPLTAKILKIVLQVTWSCGIDFFSLPPTSYSTPIHILEFTGHSILSKLQSTVLNVIMNKDL
jgi:hypothetical protein